MKVLWKRGALLGCLFLFLGVRSARAQPQADSLKIPKNLYFRVEAALSAWDSVSHAPPVTLPKSGTVTVSRQQFEATYSDVVAQLLRFESFQTQKAADLARTIRELVKIRYPDSTVSLCRFLQWPIDSCLTVPRKIWRNQLNQLERLEQIFSASTRDSTLLWQPAKTAVLSTDFWGRASVTLSGKIIFLSPKRDTLYALTIKKLKVPARVKRNFWRLHLTANLQWGGVGAEWHLKQGWALGVSSANYKRFFGELFLGIRGVGAGVGWRLFEHAGPVAGIQTSFGGLWLPTAGFAFLLN